MYFLFTTHRPFINDIYPMELDLEMYRVIYMLFSGAPFWLALILITWLALLPDMLFTVISRAWNPTGIDKCQVRVISFSFFRFHFLFLAYKLLRRSKLWKLLAFDTLCELPERIFQKCQNSRNCSSESTSWISTFTKVCRPGIVFLYNQTFVMFTRKKFHSVS